MHEFDLSLGSLCLYLAILLSTYLSYRFICVSLMYVSVCLPIYPSICSSTYPCLFLSFVFFSFIYLSMSIYLFIYLPSFQGTLTPSIHLPTYLFIPLSIYLSIFRSMHLFMHPSIYLSIYLSIYPSMSPHVFKSLSKCQNINRPSIDPSVYRSIDLSS